MSRTRPAPLPSALLALTLAAGGLATVVAPSTAHAQAAELSQPLVEVLPPGDVIADGATPLTLRVIALGADAEPLADLNGRLTGGGGMNAKLEAVGDGVYEATLTPPAVTAVQDLALTLKARTAAGSIERETTIRLVPPDARRIRVQANPARIVLGQDSTATLTFTFQGDLADAANAGQLDVRASTGTVANLTPLGDGRFTALFTASADLFPHNALLTVVDRRDPSRSYGGDAIPLVGKANFPVVGLPGSRIMMKVGEREFGPIQADADGRAQVPIEVRPGAKTATVTSVLAGQPNKVEVIDLQIPATKRVQLFPTWAAIPASGKGSIPVRALVVRPDGTGDANASVRFSTTAGTVGAATHEGKGVYVAQFTPPAGKTASNATLQVTIDDPAGAQTDALTLAMVPPLPARLALTPEPPILDDKVSTVQIFGKVTGTDGAGMMTQGLRFDVSGGSLQGAAKDLGAGDYQATITPDGGSTLDVVVTVKATPSANPLAHVLVVPARDGVRPDGQSTTGVAVLTLDAFGHPVGGVPVQLSITQGDAAIPATITTDESGIGVVPLTAGRTPGAVRVAAAAGTHQGQALLLQGPRGLQTRQLPVSGTAATQAVQVNWDALSEASLVRRSGGATVAAAPSPFAAPAGVPARLTLTASNPNAVPGGSNPLAVSILDAQGRPVTGQQLQFVASAGTVGPAQDLGGGNYAATLTVPAGTTGIVKVTAITATGIAGLLTMPVGASAPAVAGWGAAAPAAAAAPAPAPAAEPPPEPKPPKEPREPREAGAFPFARVGAGFLGGLYSYQQSPSTQQGPLYSETVTVGGQVTSPAGAPGFYIDGRVFLPGFEYVGFDASYRSNRWSMIFPGQAFEDPIPDWLNQISASAIGRYPFEIGEDSRIHVGARFGFDVNDFLYFTQEATTEDGSFDVLYQQLVVFDTSFGAELGAEVGPVFGHVAYEASFSDFNGVYSNEVDTEVGFELGKRGYISGRFGLLSRTSAVYQADNNQEVGTLTDSFTSFGLGGGMQF